MSTPVKKRTLRDEFRENFRPDRDDVLAFIATALMMFALIALALIFQL